MIIDILFRNLDGRKDKEIKLKVLNHVFVAQNRRNIAGTISLHNLNYKASNRPLTISTIMMLIASILDK